MASPWKLIVELEAGESSVAACGRLLSTFKASASDAEISSMIFDPQVPREMCVKGTGTLTPDLKALQRRCG